MNIFADVFHFSRVVRVYHAPNSIRLTAHHIPSRLHDFHAILRQRSATDKYQIHLNIRPPKQLKQSLSDFQHGFQWSPWPGLDDEGSRLIRRRKPE
ncbi:hypothetical protein [Streptomyces amakusaensis]